MDAQAIESRVLAALAQAVPGLKLESAIAPEVPFRDQLDIDSVDYLNFVLALERAFGVRVPEADCPRLSTLGGCVRFLSAATAGR